MRKLSQFSKNGYLGSISRLLQEQSSSQELPNHLSELKKDIIQRTIEVTNDKPIEQKIILSILSPALSGITDDELLKFMQLAKIEIDAICSKYQMKDNQIEFNTIDDLYGKKQKAIFQE